MNGPFAPARHEHAGQASRPEAGRRRRRVIHVSGPGKKGQTAALVLHLRVATGRAETSRIPTPVDPW